MTNDLFISISSKKSNKQKNYPKQYLIQIFLKLLEKHTHLSFLVLAENIRSDELSSNIFWKLTHTQSRPTNHYDPSTSSSFSLSLSFQQQVSQHKLAKKLKW